MRGWWGWVPLFVALAGAPTAGAETLPLGERRPVAMVVMTPPGVSAPLPSTELYRLADETLQSFGPLAIRTPEQAGIDPDQLLGCGLDERLRCYARTVVTARQSREPRYLAVVSVLRAGKDKKLTSLVMDLDAAMALSDLGDEAEDRIYAEATVTAEATLPEGDRAALAKHFQALFGSARRFFLASGYDQPRAQVTLIGSGGFSVELDGRGLGIMKGPDTVLTELLPGRRKLSLEDPEQRYLPFAHQLELVAGDDLRLEIEHRANPEAIASMHPLHHINRWGGLAVAVVGLGLTTWAIAASPEATQIGVCDGPGCSDSSRRFATFCELTSDRPASCGGGPLAGPLGVSLLLAGGGAALLDTLFTAPEEVPWWPPLASFGLGLLFYGAAAVLQ